MFLINLTVYTDLSANWKKPILTDSGGYQNYMSLLSELNKIDIKLGETIFKSHLDGKKIILSPEKSIMVQKSIKL